MKKLALAFLLLLPTTLLAASSKPNPADFTITVHVVSSRWDCAAPGGCSQILEATTDAQPVELTHSSNTVGGVLAAGNYPARLSTSVRTPKGDDNAYDIYRAYDLLMPDRTVRTFTVTGLSIAAMNP